MIPEQSLIYMQKKKTQTKLHTLYEINSKVYHRLNCKV